jgi:hypothetical protein
MNTSKNRGGMGSSGRTTKRRVAVGFTPANANSTGEYYSWSWQTSGTNVRKKNAAKKKK